MSISMVINNFLSLLCKTGHFFQKQLPFLKIARLKRKCPPQRLLLYQGWKFITNPFFNSRRLPYLCTPKFEKMFAIVKIAGQQFKVNQGQSLYVPHLSGKQGDQLEFSDVLLHSNENKISADAGKVTVKAEILDDLVKGDKVIAFKMKRRKGFRKKRGHRTQYTHIKITEIA